MPCNKKKTPVFSDEQIAECRKCLHASKNARENKGKRGWCCRFGVYIEKKSPIIQPAKRPIIMPSKFQQGRNFSRAAAAHAASGFKKKSESEIRKAMMICRSCKPYYVNTPELGERCKHKKCGCYLKLKTTWLTQHCPVGKW